MANHDAIAAAKGAVAGLTKGASATYAPHKIRVNCIAPGLVSLFASVERMSRHDSLGMNSVCFPSVLHLLCQCLHHSLLRPNRGHCAALEAQSFCCFAALSCKLPCCITSVDSLTAGMLFKGWQAKRVERNCIVSHSVVVLMCPYSMLFVSKCWVHACRFRRA